MNMNFSPSPEEFLGLGGRGVTRWLAQSRQRRLQLAFSRGRLFANTDGVCKEIIVLDVQKLRAWITWVLVAFGVGVYEDSFQDVRRGLWPLHIPSNGPMHAVHRWPPPPLMWRGCQRASG